LHRRRRRWGYRSRCNDLNDFGIDDVVPLEVRQRRCGLVAGLRLSARCCQALPTTREPPDLVLQRLQVRPDHPCGFDAFQPKLTTELVHEFGP
jgi:hypothetical protein